MTKPGATAFRHIKQLEQLTLSNSFNCVRTGPMGKVYLTLPKRRGKPPALKSEETPQLLITANSVLDTNNKRTVLTMTTGFVPMLARLCTAEGVFCAGGFGGTGAGVLERANLRRERLKA